MLIFFNIYYRTVRLPLDLKLFFALLAADGFILITDSLMWVLDGIPGTAAGVSINISTLLYYMLSPIVCLLWYFYVHYYIHLDTKRLKKTLLPMMIPTVIVFILSVLSLTGNYLFYIDDNNVYHRGNLFIVIVCVSLFYILITTIKAVQHRTYMKKQEMLPIISFMIPPVIGAVFQSLYYGLSLIWPLTTLSILFVFIRLQNKQLFTDHLTGLFNRRQLDRYLHSNMQNTEKSTLGGMMIDLNSFKKINDEFGHDAGDKALIDTSAILKQTFRKNDFIARYGGDEFIVVIELVNKSDLKKAVTRLYDNVAQFNLKKTAPYTISLSIGYDFYFDESEHNLRDFIKHLDTLMYKNKNAHTENASSED